MNIKNISTVITDTGNTSDIINVVMYAYEVENDPQIRSLAETFRADSITETCKNIWQYLIDKVDYRADADTGAGEMIRTPARLIHDGTGDCKSYSLLTAVCLRYLGIKHHFRFVSYTRIKEATHVYVIAYDEYNKPVCIDAVAYEQQKIDFNKEIPFTYRADMANSTTKISYLAGLTGVAGNRVMIAGENLTTEQILERCDVWTGGEREDEITPGKNFLYAKFDEFSELAAINNRYYDQLAIVVLLLWAYNTTGGKTDLFKEYALQIVGLIAEKAFNINVVDIDIEAYIEFLKAEVTKRVTSGYAVTSWDGDWWSLLKDEVFARNELVSVSGVHGAIADKIAKHIKGSGPWFLYMFIPDADLSKYPASVKKKKKTQKTVFTIMHTVDIFHSKSTCTSLVRSGIIAQFGATPEDYIKSKITKKVGSITAILAVIIKVVIPIVIALIKLIKALTSKKVDVSESDVQNGGGTDDELSISETIASAAKSAVKNPLTYILLAGAYFLYKKK